MRSASVLENKDEPITARAVTVFAMGGRIRMCTPEEINIGRQEMP